MVDALDLQMQAFQIGRQHDLAANDPGLIDAALFGHRLLSWMQTLVSLTDTSSPAK